MRLLFLLLLLYHNNKNSNPTRNAHPFSLFVLTPRQSCLVAYLLTCLLVVACQTRPRISRVLFKSCFSVFFPRRRVHYGVSVLVLLAVSLGVGFLIYPRSECVCVCTPPHSHGRYFVGSWLMYRPFPMFMWRSPSPCLWTFCQPVCNIETYTHTERERDRMASGVQSLHPTCFSSCARPNTAMDTPPPKVSVPLPSPCLYRQTNHYPALGCCDFRCCPVLVVIS